MENINQQPVSAPQSEAQFNQSPKKSWRIAAIIIAGILVLGGVAWGAYYLGQKSEERINQSESPSPSASVSATPDATAGWKTYSNAKDEFSISIPKDWTYQEFSPTPYVSIYFFDNGSKVFQVNRFQTTAAANAQITDLLSWAKNNLEIDLQGENGPSCKDGTSSLAQTDKNYRAVITNCFSLSQEIYTIFTTDRMYQFTAPLGLKNQNPEIYNKIYQSFEIK